MSVTTDVRLEFADAVFEPSDRVPLNVAVHTGELVLIVLSPDAGHALVRTALGFRPLARGHCRVFGGDPLVPDRKRQLAVRRRIGSVLDPAGLLPNLTVRDNVDLVAMHRQGVASREHAAAADAAVRLCGLATVADQRPGALSPTLNAWAAIARAIVGAPELLLIENAIADLSSADRHRLLHLCRSQAGAAVLTTTHPDPLFERAADQCIELTTPTLEYATP